MSHVCAHCLTEVDGGHGPFDQFGHPPVGQIPIWLSDEALDMLLWAVDVKAGEETAIYGGVNKAMQFTPRAAMTALRPDGEGRWFDRVKDELSRDELLVQTGWSYWQVSPLGRCVVEMLPPELAFRRVF